MHSNSHGGAQSGAVARVIFRSHGFVRLQLGSRVESGLFLKSLDPIVGDWVVIRDTSVVPWVLDHVLERRSLLKRRDPGGGKDQELAANVDEVWIVTSANQDLNPRRLERLLALALSSGARAHVVVTKADLCLNWEEVQSMLGARFQGVPVHLISSWSGAGLAELEAELKPGLTFTMLGSSGVGKSTLTNRLLGENHQPTQDIRGDDDKGRHTTTSRELFALPGGAFLIDQPGLREVRLSEADEGIAQVFEDLAELETRCRFSDCRHRSEPGCAVAAAYEAGAFEEDRWESYQKLKREAEFARAREAKSTRLREKERARQVRKNLKRLRKDRDREDW